MRNYFPAALAACALGGCVQGELIRASHQWPEGDVRGQMLEINGRPDGAGQVGLDRGDGRHRSSGRAASSEPRDLAVELSRPDIDRAAIELEGDLANYNFAWATVGNAAHYHLEVAADSEFKQLPF